MHRLPPWIRRRQTGAAALILYTLLALAMMAPLAPEALPFSGAQDIANHVSGVIEARNALEEGQFPIRVPPHQINGERYPLFQFYGNLPYTLGGALYLVTDADPYALWKLVVTSCLIIAGYFTYRTALRLTRQKLPALAAGAVFITAPYLLTDIHGRAAYSELVAFALLPVIFYYAWRSFATRRWGPVLAAGIGWCALALSHNITFLYGSLFLGLYFLSYAAWRRRLAPRWLRVGAGYVLGWLLAAWYLLPQQLLLPDLASGLLTPVQDAAWLTPLSVLLAPSVALPVHLGSPYIVMPEHFGLQVGWLILAAAGLVGWGLCQGQGKASGGQTQAVRVLVLFGLALFMVWSPVDFWSLLPSMFSYVQFSYRLLMFVVLFGSVLSAFALALLFKGQMRPGHLVALVLAAGWGAAPYLGPLRQERSLSVDAEIAHPDIGRGGANGIYRPSAACLLRAPLVHAAMDGVDPNTGGPLDVFGDLHYKGRSWAAFPAPVEGDQLVLEGAVGHEVQAPLRLIIAVDDKVVAAPELPPGPFQLRIPLTPTPGKEFVRVMVEGQPIQVTMEPPHPRPQLQRSYALSRFTLAANPRRPVTSTLIPAESVRPRMIWGHPSVCHLELAQPSLVQLPIMYYPRVLEVRLNGQIVPSRNLGRYVALELPPGEHTVSVRFVGLQWANRLSCVAWAGAIVAALWLVCRRIFVKNFKAPMPLGHGPHMAMWRFLRQSARQ
jgi:hypothetical protein